MKFGPTPLSEARGAILAHSIEAGGQRFKKGHVLSPKDIEALRAAGLKSIVTARLQDGDVHEDAAAAAVAQALLGEETKTHLTPSTAFTGRSNLVATRRGVLLVDRSGLDKLNRIDESVTLATLAPYALVEARQMTATVKIIPFAVQDAVLQACVTHARESGPLLRIAPLRPRQAGLVLTRVAGMKDSLLDKTLAAVNGRLAALDCPPVLESRCGHSDTEVARAINELVERGCGLVIVSGASAIVDRRDVVPAGIVEAGGRIEHFGMPVDPGNLILLATLKETPVLGLPGCARSPKLNGFDWVLQRAIADIPVTGQDIMDLGVGGLLKEIAHRPLPRAAAVERPDHTAARAPLKVAALVLAAGQSRRMGDRNKLLAPVEGRPLVAHAVASALASKASPVVVVTGHQADKVAEILAGLDILTVKNPGHAAGLSTSLHRGLGALPPDIDGVVVCLGDMPRIAPSVIDRLIAAFDPLEERAICVPTLQGKRGNPVLFAARFAPEIQEIAGDVGARYLLGEYPELVCEVAMDEDSAGTGILLDVDTPEALSALINKSRD